MDQPWYREYFWLLVFGGIILFTGIISIIMICVCKRQYSTQIALKIQKSFRKKRNPAAIQGNLFTLQTDIYGSSPQILEHQQTEVASHISHFTISQNSLHKKPLYGIPENSPSPLFHTEIVHTGISQNLVYSGGLYAKAQKNPPSLQHADILHSGIGHRPVHSRGFDSKAQTTLAPLPHSDIAHSEIGQNLEWNIYAKVQKSPVPLRHEKILHTGIGQKLVESRNLYAATQKNLPSLQHADIYYESDSDSNTFDDYEEARFSDNGYIDVISEEHNTNSKHPEYIDVLPDDENDDSYDDVEIPHNIHVQ
ncbi:uncharacterized protein O3C94_001856 isoform 1-T1 [Discoglossus pictus]